MYHIAVCDDDKRFISYMKKILHLAKEGRQCQVKIYEFASGEELLRGIDAGMHFDLLILDMELGGIDGDETAMMFRKKCRGAVLVFCSGVHAPTVKSFKATPYRYLLKSYSDTQFVSEMREIMAEIERKTKEEYILGHYRNHVMKVDIRNILYAENAKRGSKITVCPDCEEAEFCEQILADDKLKALSDKFPELAFAHSSYIINVNHVKKILGNEVYLDNDECLTVSRTYLKSFREAFAKSIADKY